MLLPAIKAHKFMNIRLDILEQRFSALRCIHVRPGARLKSLHFFQLPGEASAAFPWPTLLCVCVCHKALENTTEVNDSILFLERASVSAGYLLASEMFFS